MSYEIKVSLLTLRVGDQAIDLDKATRLVSREDTVAQSNARGRLVEYVFKAAAVAPLLAYGFVNDGRWLHVVAYFDCDEQTFFDRFAKITTNVLDVSINPGVIMDRRKAMPEKRSPATESAESPQRKRGRSRKVDPEAIRK